MSKKVLKLSAPEGARRKFLWDLHFCLRADGGSSAARARTEPGRGAMLQTSSAAFTHALRLG